VKRNKLVDLLGYILSPLKLGLLILVIIAGFIFHGSQVAMTPTAGHVFGDAILSGYGTMDLLAGFFFCAFIYRFIEKKTRSSNLSPQQLQRLALGACLVGAGLLAVIYLGFIIVAHRHSIALQGVPTEKMIGAIAKAVLDKYAALFVAVCVTLACFSTALALTAITTDFVHAKFVQKRVSHRLVLVMVVVVVFIMSNLGFAWLMNIAIPILTVLYPGLVVLTLCNIFYKLKGINLGKCFFYLTILIVIIERVM